MTYLLDTCVVSELVKPAPWAAVVDWLSDQSPDALFLSVLTIGEIRKGLIKLPDSKRKDRLATWLNTLRKAYGDRILQIDLKVCESWGILQGNAEKSGVPMAAIDSLIAATAYTHHLTLVTRNEKDFASSNIPMINPWK